MNDRFIERFLRSFVAEGQHGNSLGRTLDAGCGRAQYLDMLKPHVASILLLDRERRNHSTNILGDVQCLPFMPESFDTVLLLEVIEHVPDPRRALIEIARSLKTNGSLVVTWPMIYPLHELPQDYVRLTEFGAERLFRDCGFEIARLQRRGDLFAVVGLALDHVVHGMLETLARIPFLGILFRPVQIIWHTCSGLVGYTYVEMTRRSARLNPVKVGASLRGMDSAALWTLGYCAVLRKLP